MIHMVVHLIVFTFPGIMYPFGFNQEKEVANFLNGWYYANFLADIMPFYWISYWIFGLIILCTSGKGEQDICDADGNCVKSNVFYGVGEAVGQWIAWMLLDGVSYWIMFWFGADAIRFLIPQGGYDLKFLYPNLIYDIAVKKERTEELLNALNWEHIPGAIADNKAERRQKQEDKANGVDPNADAEDTTADEGTNDTTEDVNIEDANEDNTDI